jgi:hypothetical protein
MSPGAALGYYFERTLSSTLAGQYISSFRTLAGTPVNAIDPRNSTITADTQLTGVVDGLTLATMVANSDAGLAQLLSTISAADTSQPSDQPLLPIITAALAALAERADATADALTAEAVHHAVNGSPSRAAATLDLLAHGGGTVPELESMRTPRGGTALTHRVVLAVSPAAPAVASWPPASAAPRPASVPTLEVLLQRLLPDPGTVFVSATVDPDGPNPTTVSVSVADARISALDCVLSTPASPGPAESPSELLAVALARAARTATATADALPPTTFDLTASSDAPGLIDFMATCRLLNDLIHRSRPLTQADLGQPGTASGAAPDLSAAADAAAEALAAALRELASADASTQRTGLMLAGQLGVTGAAAAGDAATLDAAAVTAVMAELTARQTTLSTLDSSDAAARIGAALGADLPLCGPVAAADPDTLALAASAAQTPGFAPRAAIRRWLAASATVREPVAALTRALAGGMALRLDPPLIRIAQLPCPLDGSGQPTDPWIGAEFAIDPPTGARTQIAFLCPSGDLDLAAAVSGLVVDEWSEIVPERTAVTGVAYRVPTPNSQPPQAILLGVHPDPEAASWDPETLEAVLLETIDLVAIRRVDPDALVVNGSGGLTPAGIGQLLPAAYLAFNPASPPDTVSSTILPPPA